MVPVCRLCVSSTSEIIHIFGEEGLKMNIVPKINAHLPIKVTELDILPLTICMVCVNKLETFHEFVIMCLESDAKLKRSLAPSDEYEHVSELDISNSNNSFSEVGLKTFEEAPELSEKSSQGEKFTEECEYPNVEDDFDVNDILLEEQDEIQTSSQVNNHKVIVVKPEKKKKFPKKDFLVVLKMDGQNQLYENKYDTEDKLSMTALEIHPLTSEKLESVKTVNNYNNNVERVKYNVATSAEHNRLIGHIHEKVLLTDTQEKNDSKNFICEHCGKIFYKKHSLYNHMKIHTSVQHNIGQKQKKWKASQVHKKVLFNETCGKSESLSKKFICDHCDKKYYKKLTLRNHMNIHTSAAHHVEQKKQNLRQVIKKVLSNETYRKSSLFKKFICDHCGKKYSKKQILQTHMNLHFFTPYLVGKEKCKVVSHVPEETCDKADFPPKKFVCDHCGKFFTQKHNLSNHMDLHSPVPHLCHSCGKIFKSQLRFEAHNERCNSDSPFLCDICGKNIRYIGNFKRHMKYHSEPHKLNRFQCAMCGKSFPSRFVLTEHIYQHTNEKPYRCSECSKTFRTNSLLKQHSMVHSNIRHYECDACSKRLTRKSYLISHLNLHIYNNSCFTCRICARQFETLSDLHAHREFHTSEEKKLAKQTCRSMKPQKCEICGKTLFNKTTLRHHMMTHEDNKPNHCPFCKKTFAYKSALEVHIRVHTGEKPYTCMICGVGFYTKNYLLVHERLHTGERPFQCDVCNKDFRSTYSLNQHKKTHSNSRPFKCPYCSQGFKRRHVLQDHVRIHTKEKPFICKNCGNGYFQQSYCKKHEAKCVMKNIQSQSSARTQFSCLFCSENFDEEDKFHQHILSFHDMQENFGAVHDNMAIIQEEDTAEGNNGVTNELLLGQPLLCDFDPA